MLRRTCGTPNHSTAGIRQKVQRIMARSGPGEEITLLRYATRETAKHVATGCIGKLDAYSVLLTAARGVDMPDSHSSVPVTAILEVELSRNAAAA